MATVTETLTYFAPADTLDLVKTFECGQCFRWSVDAAGVYTGVAFGRAARLWTEDRGVFIDADEPDLWREYFDLDTDYGEASRAFLGISPYMDACVTYGRGIRILRQERWEALCSFILSQCNNIPVSGALWSDCARASASHLIFEARPYTPSHQRSGWQLFLRKTSHPCAAAIARRMSLMRPGRSRMGASIWMCLPFAAAAILWRH